MTEIVSCPRCQRKLQVPEEHVGRQVQCPECQTTFVASTTVVNTPAPVPVGDERHPRDDRHDHETDDDFDADIDNVRRDQIYRVAPHRGPLVFVLGLVGLVGGVGCFVPFILGPLVWALAQYDLKEIHAGRMDPSGKSMTRTGQVFGIISTVCLLIVVAVFGCLALTGA